jgi:hypothetical protein
LLLLSPAYTFGDQFDVVVGKGGTGEFVVVWTDEALDGSGYGIFGRLFDSAGTAVGGSIQMNFYTLGTQDQPGVAMDEMGSFVVVWRDGSSRDGEYSGIFAHRFDSTGQPVGTDFQVNTYTTEHQILPAVAMAPSGRLLVTWTSFYQDGSGLGTFGQLFDELGVRVGSEFQANTWTTLGQYRACAAMGEDGGFIVAWTSNDQDGEDQGVSAKMCDSLATPLGTGFQIAGYTTRTQAYPDVAIHPDGEFTVVWVSFAPDGSSLRSAWTAVRLQRRRQGFRVRRELLHHVIAQAEAAVAGLPSGDFVAVWQSYGQDGDDYGIVPRLFHRMSPVIGSHVGGDAVDCSDPRLIRPTFDWAPTATTNTRVSWAPIRPSPRAPGSPAETGG